MTNSARSATSLHEPEPSDSVAYLAKLLFATGVLLATALFFGVFFIFPLIRTQVKEEGKLRAMTHRSARAPKRWSRRRSPTA